MSQVSDIHVNSAEIDAESFEISSDYPDDHLMYGLT